MSPFLGMKSVDRSSFGGAAETSLGLCYTCEEFGSETLFNSAAARINEPITSSDEAMVEVVSSSESSRTVFDVPTAAFLTNYVYGLPEDDIRVKLLHSIVLLAHERKKNIRSTVKSLDSPDFETEVGADLQLTDGIWALEKIFRTLSIEDLSPTLPVADSAISSEVDIDCLSLYLHASALVDLPPTPPFTPIDTESKRVVRDIIPYIDAGFTGGDTPHGDLDAFQSLSIEDKIYATHDVPSLAVLPRSAIHISTYVNGSAPAATLPSPPLTPSGADSKSDARDGCVGSDTAPSEDHVNHGDLGVIDIGQLSPGEREVAEIDTPKTDGGESDATAKEGGLSTVVPQKRACDDMTVTADTLNMNSVSKPAEVPSDRGVPSATKDRPVKKHGKINVIMTPKADPKTASPRLTAESARQPQRAGDPRSQGVQTGSSSKKRRMTKKYHCAGGAVAAGVEMES